jgi:hypothetical protein
MRLARYLSFTFLALPTLLCGICVPTSVRAALQEPSTAECARPSSPTPMDLRSDGVFAFTSKMRVVNLFWWDGWDRKDGHQEFQMADIDAATRSLTDSPYFRHTCQYGSPRVVFDMGLDTSGANACPNHGPPTSRPIPTDMEAFLTCEEAMPFTSVPMVHGIPTLFLPGAPSVCSFCGTALPCFADAACRASPNPTGDLLINLFVPKGSRPFPSECKPYHFQAPTWSMGWPAAPLPGTQGRPIYYTVIPVDCYASGTERTPAGTMIPVTAVDRMMADVAHEMVEVLTDPMPGAFWYNRSPYPDDTVANNLEAADVCEHVVRIDGSGWAGRAFDRIDETDFRTRRWTDSQGTQQRMILHGYWSNKDHACIAPSEDTTPVSPALGGVDGSLLREANGAIWVILGGARFRVPDMATLTRLYPGAQTTDVPTGGINHISTIPIDGTLLREESGAIWAIFGGGRFHVPDVATLTRLFKDSPILELWNGAVGAIPTVPVKGTLLREEDEAIWVTFGGARFHVPDMATLTRLFGRMPISQLWSGATASIPTRPMDGTLLREESGAIWVSYGGAKFHVPDMATLARLFVGSPISQVWDGAVAGVPPVPVDGTLLREESNPQVFVIVGGHKIPAPQTTSGTIGRLWDGALSQIP